LQLSKTLDLKHSLTRLNKHSGINFSNKFAKGLPDDWVSNLEAVQPQTSTSNQQAISKTQWFKGIGSCQASNLQQSSNNLIQLSQRISPNPTNPCSQQSPPTQLNKKNILRRNDHRGNQS